MKMFPFVYLPRIIRTASYALVLTTIFETIKQLTFSHIHIWWSHIATMVFVTLVASVARVIYIRREDVATEKLRASLAFTDVLMDSLPAAICIIDAKGRYRRWHGKFLGYNTGEMLKLGFDTLIAPESLANIQESNKNTLAGKGNTETEALMIAKNGERIPCYLTGELIQYENEPCVLGIAIDISKQKRAEEFSHLQSIALESAADAIVITDADGTIQWVNPAFTTLTGYPLAEAVGHNPRILKSGKQDNSFYRTLWNTIIAGRLWAGDITNLRKDGKLYTEEMRIAPVRSLTGGITNFVAIKHDVTERNEAEAEILRGKEFADLANRDLRAANEIIKQLARVDELTGLANRRALDEALKSEIGRAQRLGKGLSLIMGDLDHFKWINDEFGHLIGDDVLTAAASVFINQSRSYDLAARFGGEEFILLLPETLTEEASIIAERIREKVETMKVPTCSKQITISLGVASWKQGDTPAELIARTDVALYAAKGAGRNHVSTAVNITIPDSASIADRPA